MKKTVKEYLADANKEVKLYDVAKAIELLDREDVLFIDVRDEPELTVDGKIPGAIHASRGMLEFYIDPQSPYHKEEFSSDKSFVFYCKSSGRSALAAKMAQEMGLQNVAHIAGGFNSWKEKGGPIEKIKGKEELPAL